MIQNTFSDNWPKPVDMSDERNLEKRTTRNWIQGNAIISITAMKQPGYCHVVFRRPTGVLVFCTKLENPPQARTALPESLTFSIPPQLPSENNSGNVAEGSIEFYIRSKYSTFSVFNH